MYVYSKIVSAQKGTKNISKGTKQSQQFLLNKILEYNHNNIFSRYYYVKTISCINYV